MGAEKVDKSGNDVAELKVNGETVQCPVIVGSEGEVGIDISKLRASTGAVTLDNGYVNTGSCKSSVTFLNGEKGILRYRGYPIEQLAEKSNFLEVSSLLIEGNLPKSGELDAFKNMIDKHSETPAGIKDLLKKLPNNMHPMGVLSTAVSALTGYYPEFLKADPSESDVKQIS